MLRSRRFFFKLFVTSILTTIILLFLSYNKSTSIIYNNSIISETSSINNNNNNNYSTKRLNGCILILVSNKHLNRLYNLIERLELVFNKDYNYPYVIFHYEKLNDDFKKDILNYTNSTIEFGMVSKSNLFFSHILLPN